MARIGAMVKKKTLAAAALLVLMATTAHLKRQRLRSCYVRPINYARKEKGEFHTLVADLRQLDAERHHAYFRMTTEQFDKLLQIVGPRLKSSAWLTALRQRSCSRMIYYPTGIRVFGSR